MFIKIRQQKVIDALKKLKQIHCYYNEVTLDESAKFDNSTQNVHIPNNVQEDDNNISSSYCHDLPSSEITYSTANIQNPSVPSSHKNSLIINDLEISAKKYKWSVPVLNFLPTKDKPIRYIITNIYKLDIILCK